MHWRSPRFVIVAVLAALVLAGGIIAGLRVARVRRAAEGMPLHPGARQGAQDIRYFPRLLSMDDRSSARVRRIFSLAEDASLGVVARTAQASLASNGWYLVDPPDLALMEEPQVIVWQRDPDERLDLVRLWPVPNMTREQRLHGGLFPPNLLDAPMVFEWTWALGGPRAHRPVPYSPRTLVSPPPR